MRLYGEGSYAISAVKAMSVTEEYLGLDEDVRNCQIKEDFENCTTRQYLNAVQKLCNCVPYPLRHLVSTNMIQVMIMHRIGTFKRHVFVICRPPATQKEQHVLGIRRWTHQLAWLLVRESLLMLRNCHQLISRKKTRTCSSRDIRIIKSSSNHLKVLHCRLYIHNQ